MASSIRPSILALTLVMTSSACADEPVSDDEVGDGDGDPTDDPTDDPSDPTDDPTEGAPCEGDVVACDDDPSEFMLDPSCELMGNLELQLGHGELEFDSLLTGEFPPLIIGSQGAQHMWLGVRVSDPAVDYPTLLIEISLRGCDSSVADCGQPSGWFSYPGRTLVVDQDGIATLADGRFEIVDILYVVEGYNFAQWETWRLAVEVTDPCGRQGTATIQGFPL